MQYLDQRGMRLGILCRAAASQQRTDSKTPRDRL